ncbi:class I SAM-dependent methyltransferase [Actinomadura logoneensis]|nr:class I SAM-dependent methyltransferase [Actinomadura logoneensis]
MTFSETPAPDDVQPGTGAVPAAVNSGSAWERYWHQVDRGELAEPPWNAASEEAEVPYLAMMLGRLPADLPLVDMGCGDGRLTCRLARHFDRVTGLDVSASAIARARQATVPSNVDYDVLDLSDEAGAQRIALRLGEADVHLRGVLHAMPPHTWPAALRALAALAGRRGHVFDIEVRHDREHLGQGSRSRTLMARHGQAPDRVADVGRAGLSLQRIGDLAGLYRDAGWHVVESGEQVHSSDVRLPDGSVVDYPFQYVLARPPSD